MNLTLPLLLICCLSGRLAQAQDGTPEAWWMHVESLNRDGVTGTSGMLTPYRQSHYAKFANAVPEPDKPVRINDGETHIFYDLDLVDVRIVVENGSDVTFYNCRFGQQATTGKNAPLEAKGANTKLTLRFCDFLGGGTGRGAGMMLRAAVDKATGQHAAEIDAAYCRTWGYPRDGWKIARGTVKFCFFDTPVTTAKIPETWQANKTYRTGDFVVEDIPNGRYRAHMWEAARSTRERPSFSDRESDNLEDPRTGWIYRNPHADVLHIYGSRYSVTARGLFVNSSTQSSQSGVVAGNGVNNVVRRDNGYEELPQGGDLVQGCLILRNGDKEWASTALHDDNRVNDDNQRVWFEYLRIGGKDNKAVHKDSHSIQIGLTDPDGNPLNYSDRQRENLEIRRGNPADAPKLAVASQWLLTPTGFAPYQGGNAVVYFVDGRRVARVTADGTPYADSGYRIARAGNGEYQLTANNEQPFRVVTWRGQSTNAPGSGDANSATWPAAYYFIRNRASGLKVRNEFPSPDYPLAELTNRSGDYVQWEIAPAGGGYVRLKNKGSGKFLRVKDRQTAPGTLMQLTDGEGNYAQWKIEGSTGNYVLLKNKVARLNMRPVNCEAVDDQTQLELTAATDPCVQWELIPVNNASTRGAAETTRKPTPKDVIQKPVRPLIWPNPASERIRISLYSGGKAPVMIIDLHGRVLIDQTVRHQALLSIASLKPGIYQVITREPKGLRRAKLVVE